MPAFNTILQFEESADAVYERLSRTLRFPGSNTSVCAEPDLIVVTGRHRPRWATWLGLIGLLIVVGGLLLFYKKTEELQITISSRVGGGATVNISGEAEQTIIYGVQRALITPTRSCPNCKALMMREARTCPRCGTDSEPWIFNKGFWWRHDDVSGWQWLWLPGLDKGQDQWRMPLEGTDAGRAQPSAVPASSPADST